jgi:uncharacterized membrane protein
MGGRLGDLGLAVRHEGTLADDGLTAQQEQVRVALGLDGDAAAGTSEDHHLHLAHRPALMLLAWIMVANLIFVGLAQGISPSFGNALGYLFPLRNLPMLAVGTAMGAIFALAVFALSAVSSPMLADLDDIDALSAMQISVAACLYNWRPMLVWAVLIALVILAGFCTFYVGLAIGFPLIGHATWHAYRGLLQK